MKTIITIGRQFGSGGKEVGIRVAKELSIPFYDKELLQEAAKKSGLCQKIFENFDERPKSLLYAIAMDAYPLGFSGTAGESLEQQVHLAIFKTIRHIAEEGPCVIIGRSADYALAENPNLLSLFISAPLEDRIARVAKRQKVTPEEAKKFTEMAKRMAIEWERRADDGDHYRLAFDMPGTWSQKYNFVWDKVLGLNILPDRIMKKEVTFYLKTQNKYGLPLDNRFTWGKTDDTVWSATMADSEGDFQELIRPIWKYVNETSSRVPLGDWYETLNADYINFRARSVVGGVFMKSLDHYLRNKRK